MLYNILFVSAVQPWYLFQQESYQELLLTRNHHQVQIGELFFTVWETDDLIIDYGVYIANVLSSRSQSSQTTLHQAHAQQDSRLSSLNSRPEGFTSGPPCSLPSTPLSASSRSAAVPLTHQPGGPPFQWQPSQPPSRCRQAGPGASRFQRQLSSARPLNQYPASLR